MTGIKSRKIVSMLFFIVSSFICQIAVAGSPPCKGHLINPADICWNCIYPITFGGVTVVKGKLPDTPNPKKTFCACGHFPDISFGMTIGFWEPFALVDVTRTPFCLVNFGGRQIPLSHVGVTGYESTSEPSESQSFYNVHIYSFPLFHWLGLFNGCSREGSFAVQYMSELDPAWSDDKLAAILYPETLAYATPALQAMCAVSAANANRGLPDDKLFWCAGGQGSIYPLVGTVAYHESGFQASLLLTERAAFLMHEEGKWLTTDGSRALCHAFYHSIMLPSQYRYQPLYPKNKSCEPFGRSTLQWSSGLETPTSSENYAYIIWQKVNCCDTE